MTNRQYLDMLSGKQLYKIMAAWLMTCKYCNYHGSRGCEAPKSGTCLQGRLQWLKQEYKPGAF